MFRLAPSFRFRRPGWLRLTRLLPDSLARPWPGARRGLPASPLLQELLGRVPDHVTSLQELGRTIEGHFVALGQALDLQAELTGSLLTRSERFAGPGATAALESGVKFAQQLLDAIGQCRSQTRDLLGGLARYHTQTRLVLEAEADVERVLSELRAAQALFRIESAQLPAEMQSGVAALAAEIPRFEQEVRTTFAAHTATLVRAGHGIGAMLERLGRTAAEQDRRVAGQQEEIDRSLASLTHQCDEGRERHARFVQGLRRIEAETRELVINLQYQDITRQQMEHVAVTLQELAVARDGRGGLSRDADLPTLQQACRVDAHQTRAIAEQLERALDALDHGVRGVVAGLEALTTEGADPDAMRASGDAVRQDVGTLLELVADVHALVVAALAGAEEAADVIRSCDGLAADVAASVRETAECIALIALNAQILAAQAGDRGAGLLVLAEHTYRISNDIRGITQTLGCEFDDARQQLTALTAQCVGLKQRAAAWRTGLAEQRGAVEARLAAYRDDVSESFAAAGATLERLQAHATHLLQLTRFPATEAARLDRLRADLEALATALPGSSGPSDASADLDRLERRYTMESEREAHASALGRKPPSVARVPVTANPARPATTPAPAEARPGTDTAGASLGDNVELF